MSLSATSFVSLQLLMVLYATTKTRHAKIVSIRIPCVRTDVLTFYQAAKSVIANMIAQSSVISPLASSVVSAATQVIWLVTAQIDSVELIGVMALKEETAQLDAPLVPLLDALVAGMLMIVNTR